jgi:hypothetical protein
MLIFTKEIVFSIFPNKTLSNVFLIIGFYIIFLRQLKKKKNGLALWIRCGIV